MPTPDDFEYIVHRPGDPKTQSLGHGYCAHNDAARSTMTMARDLLDEGIPFVGIDITRFKILILIANDSHAVPSIDGFDPDQREQLKEHTVIHKDRSYLDDQIETCPVYKKCQTILWGDRVS